MALDDLIRIGKQSTAAEKAREAFDKDNSVNLALGLADISGIERANPMFYGMIKNASPDFTPSRHGSEYKAFNKGQIELSFNEVQGNPNEAFDGIGNDNIAPYLIDRKPFQFEGANEETLGAHAGAYEGNQFKKADKDTKKKSAKALMASETQRLTGAKINPGIIKLANTLAKATDYAEPIGLLEQQADAAIDAFKGLDKGELRGYGLARYMAVPDNAKPGEAYEVAKAVGQSH